MRLCLLLLVRARPSNGHDRLCPASVRAHRFNTSDCLVRVHVAVWYAAEDNVLVVEPRGNDSGDEELRAISSLYVSIKQALGGGLGGVVRVWSCIGHGQEEGLVVL